MEDKKLNLIAFGQHVISEYESDQSMVPVRQLYASFMATLPTAMIFELWNSISTLLLLDLRKLLSTDSIDECLNVKVNGPPLSASDSCIVASEMANKSISNDIDVHIHINQQLLDVFFSEIEMIY